MVEGSSSYGGHCFSKLVQFGVGKACGPGMVGVQAFGKILGKEVLCCPCNFLDFFILLSINRQVFEICGS